MLIFTEPKYGGARPECKGDESEVVTALIVAGDVLFAGSSDGCFHALNEVTGGEQWSDCTGSTMYGPDEHNVSQPLTGMNAGEGYLVVPAGTMLIAYD